MRRPRLAVVAAVVLVALVVASAALTAIGWPIWFHFILCGVPVFLAIRRRSGWALAFAATVTGVCAALTWNRDERPVLPEPPPVVWFAALIGPAV
ncbi:hypothetical protein [uncultured Leifsonia sp.]|uniref:hypothetical protein n=1 Tax=uncultured Leifsonia sp. TaxID=340359 RepID=UPI0025D9A263|nr:hypothetical protein [uncultured Leifsonia sp.]